MNKFTGNASFFCLLAMLVFGLVDGVVSAGTPAAGNIPANADPIKFGMFYEMTGDFATNGERHYNAAVMTIEEINAAGGVLGRPIKLVTADNSSTNAGAVTALEIMLAEKVDCLVGPGFSSMCLAVADKIKAEGIPTIMSGTSLALVEPDMPKNWFRNLCPDDLASICKADFLVKDKKFTKFFVVYENTTFGTGNLKFITQALDKYGIKIMGTAAYNPGDADFTPQIMTAQQADPECVIFFSASSADAAVLARQVKELGCDFAMQGSTQFGSGVTKRLAGDALEGIYAIQAYNKNSSPLAKEFNDKYEARYNDPADHFNGWVRDAIYVLADAMNRAGTTEFASVVAALRETKDFPAVCGNLTCDDRNELQHNTSIVHVENGEYVVQIRQ